MKNIVRIFILVAAFSAFGMMVASPSHGEFVQPKTHCCDVICAGEDWRCYKACEDAIKSGYPPEGC